MADKKKEEGGGAKWGPLETKNPWEFLIIIGIILLLGSALIANVSYFLGTNPLTRSLRLQHLYATTKMWFAIALPYLQILSFLVSAGLMYLIISTSRKLSKINKQIKEKYAPPKVVPGADARTHLVEPNPAMKKWQRVLDHIESQNPNDWKIAIIEADAILDEMVDSMGYNGESLGEKLKGVEQSDFTTLNNAWEAHKVRNMIAHEASYQLSEREARRVVDLYRTVFEEFHYI